jgi:hypothetical protein
VIGIAYLKDLVEHTEKNRDSESAEEGSSR